MKRFIIGIGVVIVLLVVLVILLPFIIDLNRYQAQYRPIIEEALNRKVTLKNIRLVIIPQIGVRVSGFTVRDDPAFSAGPFVSLASLDVGVKWRPLLSRRVEIEKITLRDPVITVIKNPEGVLNTSTLGKKGSPKPQAPSSSSPSPTVEGPLSILTLLAFDQVSLTRGKLVYRDLSATKPTEYTVQQLELLLKSVGLGQTASLYLAAVMQPLNLPIKLDGTLGPLKEKLDIQNINLLIMLGKTILDIKGNAGGGGIKLEIRSPVVSTASLPGASAFKKPIEAKDLQIVMEAKDSRIRLSNFSFNLFDGQLTMQGGVTAGSGSPPFDGKLQVRGLPLKPVMEAVGTGKVTVSGTAAAELSLQGRGFSMPDLTNALEGNGRLVVKDGKIEGVDLIKEVYALLKMVGVKHDITNATTFSTIESSVAIKHGIITVERLQMDGQDFQATATGTIGFNQKLKLMAKLSLSQELSRQIGNSASVAKSTTIGNRITVPIHITGTLSAPAFALDPKAMGAMVQEQVKKQVKEKVRQLLKGLKSL